MRICKRFGGRIPLPNYKNVAKPDAYEPILEIESIEYIDMPIKYCSYEGDTYWCDENVRNKCFVLYDSYCRYLSNCDTK